MTALLAATFLLLQVVSQVFATEGSECELPSGYVSFSEYNAAYKIDEDDISWAVARDRCVAEGAHLAVITSVEQINKIVNSTLLDSEIVLHTGIHRSATTSPWVRVDNGLPATLSPVVDDGIFNCAVIWCHGPSFRDHDCNSQTGFICERSLPEGCPSPVDPEDSQGSPASTVATEQKSAEE